MPLAFDDPRPTVRDHRREMVGNRNRNSRIILSGDEEHWHPRAARARIPISAEKDLQLLNVACLSLRRGLQPTRHIDLSNPRISAEVHGRSPAQFVPSRRASDQDQDGSIGVPPGTARRGASGLRRRYEADRQSIEASTRQPPTSAPAVQGRQLSDRPNGAHVDERQLPDRKASLHTQPCTASAETPTTANRSIPSASASSARSRGQPRKMPARGRDRKRRTPGRSGGTKRTPELRSLIADVHET